MSLRPKTLLALFLPVLCALPFAACDASEPAASDTEGPPGPSEEPRNGEPPGDAGPSSEPDAHASDAGGDSGGGGEPPKVAPWREVDFKKYADTAALLADCADDGKALFSCVEDINAGRIALDSTTGYGTSDRSMRYDFPDRTGSGNRCADYTISRSVPFPSQVSEVWVEIVAKFATNFKTKAPDAWSCTSNADYKFIFGNVYPGSRFGLYNGVFGNSWHAGYPGNEAAYTGHTGDKPTAGLPLNWDGEWHTYRFHWKLSTPNQNDGVFRWWMDGKLIVDDAAIRTTDNSNKPITAIYALALGRNLNQGPAQDTSVWWGRVRIWNEDPQW